MPARLTNYATFLATSVLGSLRTPRPDLVVALTDPPIVGLIGAMTARIRRRPFVLIVQDIHPQAAVASGQVRRSTLTRLLEGLGTLLFRSADRVVSIGRDMDRRLLGLGVPPAKLVRIDNWGLGTIRRDPSAAQALRQAHGWNEQFVVMHSGNIGWAQGLEVVIGAADLLRRRSEIVIAIVGQGTKKSALQAEVKRRRLENVTFLPLVPQALLGASLGAADVHLVVHVRGMIGYEVPSKIYGVLAVGKPVVAALQDGSEVSLILRDLNCGVRVEPDDPVGLAAAIEWMCDAGAAELQQMAERAHSGYERHYTREIAVHRYLELFRSLVPGR
jgi:glycosyltransferase involved in cell wall biosynthesis